MKYLRKILFWFVQCTWGIIDNIIGTLIFIVLVCTGHKPRKFGNQVHFLFGTKSGSFGLNFGWVAVVAVRDANIDKYYWTYLSLLMHEHGHFIQNLFMGPFCTIMQIVSAIRFWYRRIVRKRNTRYLKSGKPEKYKVLGSYNAFWFEGQADYFGEKYYLEEVLEHEKENR